MYKDGYTGGVCEAPTMVKQPDSISFDLNDTESMVVELYQIADMIRNKITGPIPQDPSSGGHNYMDGIKGKVKLVNMGLREIRRVLEDIDSNL